MHSLDAWEFVGCHHVDISLIILLVFSILYSLNRALYLLNCIFSFLTSVYNLLLDWIGGRSMYSSSRA